ncbi:MAG: peptidoglycan-binding protein LysM [Flavobacterium sp.]|nr:peptidoglycan-binding protein LysM [Flavobacterium sp.]
MIKKWSFYTSLTLIIAFLSSGFKPFNFETTHRFIKNDYDGRNYQFPSQKQNEYTKESVSFVGKLFIDYKEAIAFRESQGKYKKINSLGYLGKYQFGTETLKSVGVHNKRQFLNSPKMQEQAFIALVAKNKSELIDIIEKYEGRIISGILMTESGILAAAHLGGAGSVKRFFKHEGKRHFKDAYGTSIRSYMRDFGGYETSGIVADSNATVQ